MAKVDKLKIGILGPGAVGCLLAALFCKAQHEVICIGSERTVDDIQNNGLVIHSAFYGDFIAHPLATTYLTNPLDVIFIAVKAPFLTDALARISVVKSSQTVIVPLLNGIGHREIIRTILGPQVIVGTIGALEVYMGEHREVLHRSSIAPHMELASDSDISFEYVEVIAEVARKAGLTVDLMRSENAVIWRKLTRLCAIATMTTYANASIGKVRRDSILRPILRELVREVSVVAFGEGFNIHPNVVMAQIDMLPEGLTTSMQRDVIGGAYSEIESILGEVIRLGLRQGISLPTAEKCYTFILNGASS